jgi:hypothetical protein
VFSVSPGTFLKRVDRHLRHAIEAAGRRLVCAIKEPDREPGAGSRRDLDHDLDQAATT